MKHTIIVLFCCFLIACGSQKWITRTYQKQIDAGAVNVAVTFVAPWEYYAQLLSPNFTLDAAEALEK